MALSPSPNARVFVDKDTGEIAIAIGDPATGNFQIVGTQWAATLLRDREGHEVRINANGGLHVVQQDPDDASRLGEFDTVHKVPVGITVAHREAHERCSFISDFVDETLANDATVILAFKTPSPPMRIHMFFEATTLVGGDLVVLEGPTWDAETGAANPIINRFRDPSTKSSDLLENEAQAAFTASDNIISNPTTLAGGTTIHHFFLWGKQGTIKAGGVRDTQEFILAPDTQYAAKFTAEGAANKAQIILNWYEHPDE